MLGGATRLGGVQAEAAAAWKVPECSWHPVGRPSDLETEEALWLMVHARASYGFAQVRFSRVQKGVNRRWFLESDWEH